MSLTFLCPHCKKQTYFDCVSLDVPSTISAPEPREGDKATCPDPDCKGIMTWVCLGEPEGDFYQCEDCDQAFDKNVKELTDVEDTESETECMDGGLWFTTMGRIVLDDHNNETFVKGYDKKLMTKEELTNGIFLDEFMKRITGLITRDREDRQHAPGGKE
ncbi:hypothetical protein LCGC14_1237110 [marine sediment metagenome]|uniref:Uncharacterized protein n=1 Tax=marine sediment metagenome TaxID=412755 RepID=A0A0F9LB12_9ZZZZ